MTLYFIERDDVIEEQLKAIDEFERYNTDIQLKEMPKVDKVFEFFEDVFDYSCEATMFTNPHFETTKVVSDLIWRRMKT